jgi:hypothetical protein
MVQKMLELVCGRNLGKRCRLEKPLDAVSRAKWKILVGAQKT